MKTYYSHGKLLLSAEYFVLDGAKALAIPTRRGQSLSLKPSKTPGLHWKSLLEDGATWFETQFDIQTLKAQSYQNNNELLQRLGDILQAALRQQPKLLDDSIGLEAIAHLEFHRDWGLGSSSSLINNIATWAQINPYALLSDTFGGSGYDIACAKAETPITYQRTETDPIVMPATFNPLFKDALFFVHLNQKQNSRDSIAHYRSLEKEDLIGHIQQFNTYTEQMIAAKTLASFANIMEAHEALLSEILQTPTVKSRLFTDYSGTIKSLGGWGGDFVMATGSKKDMLYFKKRGYSTIIPYSEMILY